MAADGQRVVVVTGGGGGIGAAIAEELGRQGDFVVTLDPLVSVDGAEQLPAAEETTAGRIVASGGAARASAASVTDGEAVRTLFHDLVGELGRLDAVINVAGISRPSGYASGTEADWRAVLDVHLNGYLNVLAAAIPIMAAAGRGHILGVTSGSGWRAADTGAYGCAKRAVASLTWQLGRQAPAGVVINAVSPIAATRMVTAALERASAARGGSASTTGGLSLGSMPQAEDIGPFGAHLVDESVTWCNGEIFFAGGAEVAVVEGPSLLEVVRTDGAASVAHVLEAATTGALVPAEAQQASAGGSNPRFAAAYDAAPEERPLPAGSTAALVADRPEVAAALAAALDARGVITAVVPVPQQPAGFPEAAALLAAAAGSTGPLDAVVVALAGGGPGPQEAHGWERILAEHTGLAEQIAADAAWSRAVADHAVQADRPVRVVTLTDAATAGGRSRAQAAAQLARSARKATGDRVTAFAVSAEGPGGGGAPVPDLVVHLLVSAETPALSGAELVASRGWVGLRSHPRPSGSISFGGPALPSWIDAALQGLVGRTPPQEDGP